MLQGCYVLLVHKKMLLYVQIMMCNAGLLIAVALRYRYCSGATFTVAVAPLLLAESSGDSSAATFLATF